MALMNVRNKVDMSQTAHGYTANFRFRGTDFL